MDMLRGNKRGGTGDATVVGGDAASDVVANGAEHTGEEEGATVALSSGDKSASEDDFADQTESRGASRAAPVFAVPVPVFATPAAFLQPSVPVTPGSHPLAAASSQPAMLQPTSGSAFLPYAGGAAAGSAVAAKVFNELSQAWQGLGSVKK